MPPRQEELSILHLNVIGFRAAVAGVKDTSLTGRPYAITGAKSGRSMAIDCSPEAVKQGVFPGMPLAAAERMIKDLIVLPPDPLSYEKMNSELEKEAANFAPIWENDRSGNLYLDITGTSRIFGSPVDHANKILNEIKDRMNITPAIAVASNKLVSKVATRAIRPFGFVQVEAGTEAAYMEDKDIRILSNMGPNLLRTAAAIGMREIGEIATLSVPEAISLFGKHGPLLRNMALGIDGSRVEERRSERRITQQVVFSETVIEDTIIRGALEALTENGGLQMRSGRLGTRTLRLAIGYSDDVTEYGIHKSEKLLITDREIMAAACALYQKTAKRRIRLRLIGLCLEDLSPLGFEPDLFLPEIETKNRKFQEAVDRIQKRYGAGTLMRGSVLEASGNEKNGKRSDRLIIGSGTAASLAEL